MASRRYVPEPVYIVERFDRRRHNGRVERRHAIDACQLLDRPRVSKYTGATVESLGLMAEACRVRAAARLQLFRWLAFNVLAGNADNHLKNVSFLVSADGIEPAPVYDLLCTAVYTTRAFNDAPNWPDERLAIALPGARTFGEMSRSSLAEAGRALGLALPTAERELARMVDGIGPAARKLIETIEHENASLPDSANRMLAGERRLLETITTVVIGDMIARLR
jgi:serine/threonine-protein kinase HipA